MKIMCPDYRKLPGKKTCQFFISNGACKKPDIDMCTEWLRKNKHYVPDDILKSKPVEEKAKPEEQQRPSDDLFVTAPVDNEVSWKDIENWGKVVKEWNRENHYREKPLKKGWCYFKYKERYGKNPPSGAEVEVLKEEETKIPLYKNGPLGLTRPSRETLEIDLTNISSLIGQVPILELAKKYQTTNVTEEIINAQIEEFKKFGVEVELNIRGKSVWLVPQTTNAERIELPVEMLRGILVTLATFPSAKLMGITVKENK